MKKMSTTSKYRLFLATVAVVLAIGLFWQGYLLAGIASLITAVLLLPLLYRWLCIDSTDVQIVSPMLFVLVTFIAFLVFDAVPASYETPLNTTYIPPSVTTTTSARDAQTVYRTPSGKKYHLDEKCGGENAYAVTYKQAQKDGLEPCKKCTE